MSQSTQQYPCLPQGKTFQGLVKMAPLLSVIYFRLCCSSLCGLGFSTLGSSPGVCECRQALASVSWVPFQNVVLGAGSPTVRHCGTHLQRKSERELGLRTKEKNKNKKKGKQKGNSNTYNKNKSIKLFFSPL